MVEAGGGRVLERSRRFVRAAQDLIAGQGFEGLTLRAVLDRTRLSRRAFYERFEGMDDLILAVFEETLREAAERFRAEIEEVDDPLEGLRFIIEAIVLGAQSDAAIRNAVALSREHLRLAEARPADLQRALVPLTSMLAEQLALGMERRVVREADPRELAMLVHNLVSSTVHASLFAEHHEANREDSAARLASTLWEFCLRAVRTDAGDGSR